jgi:CRP/FNR family transcriptional regulator, anaerobic regulatory protein
MNTLKDYFRGTGFDEDRSNQIVQAFELQDFSRDEFVVEQGKICKHFGFVKSGMFQYFILKDGEEKTSYVSIQNTWFASLLSFLSETPALENVRALTDGNIYMISRANLKRLNKEVAGFSNFYISLLEASICGIDSSRHDLIMLTAEQRYEKMLAKEPQMIQQIPLQYLASMLGVTPRHLSRIRNNIR